MRKTERTAYDGVYILSEFDDDGSKIHWLSARYGQCVYTGHIRPTKEMIEGFVYVREVRP